MYQNGASLRFCSQRLPPQLRLYLRRWLLGCWVTLSEAVQWDTVVVVGVEFVTGVIPTYVLLSMSSACGRSSSAKHFHEECDGETMHPLREVRTKWPKAPMIGC